ncbi:unnamed protein product [Didymodactylos carnosus]|uniref:Protein kinase domain-containing protein n=1 Tax=Didymodactylos carnosus TaxID=1234261 RepID=A0A813VPD5_9BILA|nr:unnamed protein product [Didymodactylos carnosus]CAF3630938.1 unnamed protein product [Didymodactylos carnosus]
MHRWSSVDDVRFVKKKSPPLPPSSFNSIISNNHRQNSAVYINVPIPFYLNKDNDHHDNFISSRSGDNRRISFNNDDGDQYSASTHAQNDKSSSSYDYYVTTLPTKTNTIVVQLPSYATTYTFSLNQPLRSLQSLTSLTSIESSLSINDKKLNDTIEESSSSSLNNITDNDGGDTTKICSYKSALHLSQQRLTNIVNSFKKGSTSNMSSTTNKFQKLTNTRNASLRCCSTSSTSSTENGGNCISPCSPTNGTSCNGRTNHFSHKNSVFSKLWERRNDMPQKKPSTPVPSITSMSFNFPNNGPIVIVEKSNSQIKKSSPIIVYERISSENNSTTFRTNHDRNEKNLKHPKNKNIYRTELVPKSFTPVNLNKTSIISPKTFTKAVDQSKCFPLTDDDSAIQLSLTITHATSEDSLLAGSENTLSILSRSSTTATTSDSSNSDNQDTSSSMGSYESKNIFKSYSPTKSPSFARPTISSMQKTRDTTDQHLSFTKPDEIIPSAPLTFHRRKSLDNISVINTLPSLPSPVTLKPSATFQRQTLGRGSLRVSSTSSKPRESIIAKSPIIKSPKKELVYSEFKKISDIKAVSCDNLSKETKMPFNEPRNEQQSRRTKLWTVDEDNLDENVLTPTSKAVPIIEPIVVHTNSDNDDNRLSSLSTMTMSSSNIEGKKVVMSPSMNNSIKPAKGRFMSEVNLFDQYRRFLSDDAIRSDSTLFDTNKPLKYKQDSLMRLYGFSKPDAERIMQPSEVVLEDDVDPPFLPRNVAIKKTKWVTDEYDLLEFLGRGKFGEVKKCREKLTDRQLAAKFIQISKEQDRIEAINEIDIMKALQHPRLLQLYDAYEKKGEICLIMELITGGELFERVIDDDFILTERLCELYMMQICEGVQFMHLSNIIHLDMKPENILCLNRDGHRIKIIDFGLARKYDPTKQLKVLFGTPEFVAPEVINFDRVGYGTDMWSVGVICYVLLSGLSPFMGDNDNDTYANINRANYDFDDEAFSDISMDAKDFISKLLVKDKDKRLAAKHCLQHPWLTRHPKTVSPKNIDDETEKKLSTKKLRRFVIRRRWQKAVNALLALQRMGMTL